MVASSSFFRRCAAWRMRLFMAILTKGHQGVVRVLPRIGIRQVIPVVDMQGVSGFTVLARELVADQNLKPLFLPARVFEFFFVCHKVGQSARYEARDGFLDGFVRFRRDATMYLI